jgi:YidC/Oxa1 family membrane protein insertase
LSFKDYQTWDDRPVQLISDTTRSAYSLGFLTRDNENIETQTLLFRPLFEAGQSSDPSANPEITLADGEIVEIGYELPLADGRNIRYIYFLNGSNHEMELVVELDGVQQEIIGNSVDLGWKPRLNFTEKDATQDGQYVSAYVRAGGELERLKLMEPGRNESRVNGTIEWVATKTKFFTQIIKPSAQTEGAYLVGEMNGDIKEALTRHAYESSVTVDISESDRIGFQLYVGPISYYALRNFEETTYGMTEIGYAWMRWFAEPLVKWLIIPFFTFSSQYIANYGILIILFGVLVKLILTPLTLSSFRSMAGMRELQPQLAEVQSKYKENPQKLQQETMKLYRQNKVNPLGGCLPMLLQFPILITLWTYFQSSILLRQKDFLWASDLSAPDYLVSLPFAIPFLGDQIAGFVVLMAASILLQTKVSGGMTGAPTTPGAPNMKVFMYIMPVMLLFFFNNFASGLSLYYLVFNVLSIGQQAYINRNKHLKPVVEETKGGVKRSEVMKSGGKSGKRK